MVQECKDCSFRCEELLNLIKHCFQTHSFEPAFSLVCGIQGCLHQFKFGSTFSSFKTHATRKHPNWRNELGSHRASIQLSDDNNSVTYDPEVSSFDEVTYPNECPSSDSDTADESDGDTGPARSVEETAALFLLTLKEKYKLTQTALNFALGGVNQIVTGVCDSIEQSLKASIDTSTLGFNISSVFEYNDPFSTLQTEYQQSKFYREHFGLVVSGKWLVAVNKLIESVLLGTRYSATWVILYLQEYWSQKKTC